MFGLIALYYHLPAFGQSSKHPDLEYFPPLSERYKRSVRVYFGFLTLLVGLLFADSSKCSGDEALCGGSGRKLLLPLYTYCNWCWQPTVFFGLVINLSILLLQKITTLQIHSVTKCLMFKCYFYTTGLLILWLVRKFQLISDNSRSDSRSGCKMIKW